MAGALRFGGMFGSYFVVRELLTASTKARNDGASWPSFLAGYLVGHVTFGKRYGIQRSFQGGVVFSLLCGTAHFLTVFDATPALDSAAGWAERLPKWFPVRKIPEDEYQEKMRELEKKRKWEEEYREMRRRKE